MDQLIDIYTFNRVSRNLSLVSTSLFAIIHSFPYEYWSIPDNSNSAYNRRFSALNITVPVLICSLCVRGIGATFLTFVIREMKNKFESMLSYLCMQYATTFSYDPNTIHHDLSAIFSFIYVHNSLKLDRVGYVLVAWPSFKISSVWRLWQNTNKTVYSLAAKQCYQLTKPDSRPLAFNIWNIHVVSLAACGQK